MKKIKILLTLCLVSSFTQTSLLARSETTWLPVENNHAPNKTLSHLYKSDQEALLEDVNHFSQISVPAPNGRLYRFNLRPSNVLPASLQARYPQIRSFVGSSVEHPHLTGRFDFSPKGFSAMFAVPNGDHIDTVYIDPEQGDLHRSYIVSPKELAKARSEFTKHSPKLRDLSLGTIDTPFVKAQKLSGDRAARNMGVTYTYRLAMSAAGEYSEYHGGTKASVLAEITRMVNRLNEIFTVELGVDFQLVANNDDVIFLDAATDPFQNDSNDGELNQDVLDDAFGVNGYDIGHIVNTDGGGLAVLGALCSPSFKADGVTGSNQPTGDAFWVDFVAHELGHQFGANHTFNATNSSCGSNREASAAFEPGAGTTIMSYAGICGEQNVTNAVHDNFHHHSLFEMNERITEIEAGRFTIANCGSAVSTSNHFPVVEAGDNYIIPANTYFRLNGTATDADGDTLFYSWEQADLGNPGTATREAGEQDQGQGPLFRAYSPVARPDRFFPSLNYVRTGNLTGGFTFSGETIPSTNRTMAFTLTVRDGQGGVASDNMSIQVVDTGEGFTLTAPQAGDSFTQNPITVNWNVAGTDQAPISCASVDIVLSRDSGINFDRTLASGIPNSGSAQINLPASETQERFQIMQVRCSDNVFYASHTGVFSSQIEGETLTITGQQTLTTAEETALTLAPSDFTTNLNADTLTVLTGTNYTVSGTTITPALNFTGNLTVNVQMSGEGEQSPIFGAIVNVTNVNDAPVANNDDAQVVENSIDNLLSVLSNDEDADNDTLTITAASADSGGSVNIISTGIEYTPTAGFVGTETVSYTISDGELTDTAEVSVFVTQEIITLEINGQNELVIDEDSSITLTTAMFSSNLTLDGLTVESGSNYTVSGTTVSPIANFNGTLTVDVIFTAGDQVSGIFPTQITVNAVNDAPVASNDRAQTTSGNVINITVLDNDSDIDNSDLTVTGVTTAGSGSVSLNGNVVMYTSAAGFTGTETLTYTISDGELTDTANVILTVNAPPAGPPIPDISQGGGGGSMSWFGLLALGAVAMRRLFSPTSKS